MVGHVLNLKQLEALVWVVELQSFRKAAQHLNTTQPNISARITSLEKYLGIVLMQRDSGTIQLTDKGQEILILAHSVLREFEKIYHVAGRNDLVADRVRLGVTELVACTWLHTYLRKIKEIYPSIDVELTVDLSINLDKDLSRSALDLTVQTWPFSSAASGVIELGKFPYKWVVGHQLKHLKLQKRSVKDLLPYSILTHARHTQAYKELVAHISQNKLSASKLVSSNSLASCVQMAKDGMGVTLLPEALVEADLKVGSLIGLDVDWLPSPLRFAARFQREKATTHVTKIANLAAASITEFESGR